MSEWAKLRRLINGYQVSQALHVAAVLGLSDVLAEAPRTVVDLAEATRCDPRSLFRLLRALASIGVYEDLGDGRFGSTELGEQLRSDAADSLAGWATFIGRPYHWQSWAELLHSVRTGENAFTAAHGQGIWEYRASHPDESAVFDAAMTSLSGHVSRLVLAAYSFDRFSTIVDVGGGRGGFLAAILARHPRLEGVLFDQPQVVAGAAPTLQAHGVGARCRVVAGDFFGGIPDGGDAYLLKSILHDWDDQRAIDILHSCRRAMPPNAALLIVERLIGGSNQGLDAAFSDLNMLVGPGGQERTESEYAALLETSGFRLTRTVPTADEIAVLEAAPV